MSKSKDEFLNNLYTTLKKAQKRWCAESVDDAEEMWTEYPDLIDSLIPELEDVLEIPRTGLVIHSAFYGCEESVKDVKDIIESNIEFNSVSLKILNSTMGGDPAPNKAKVLKIEYSYKNKKKEITVNECKTLKLP